MLYKRVYTAIFVLFYCKMLLLELNNSSTDAQMCLDQNSKASEACSITAIKNEQRGGKTSLSFASWREYKCHDMHSL